MLAICWEAALRVLLPISDRDGLVAEEKNGHIVASLNFLHEHVQDVLASGGGWEPPLLGAANGGLKEELYMKGPGRVTVKVIIQVVGLTSMTPIVLASSRAVSLGPVELCSSPRPRWSISSDVRTKVFTGPASSMTKTLPLADSRVDTAFPLAWKRVGEPSGRKDKG